MLVTDGATRARVGRDCFDVVDAAFDDAARMEFEATKPLGATGSTSARWRNRSDPANLALRRAARVLPAVLLSAARGACARRTAEGTSRGAAAGPTWIFPGDESRRRRGCDVDTQWRRAAATRSRPRRRRGGARETMP